MGIEPPINPPDFYYDDDEDFESEDDSRIDAYEENMNRDMTDADQDKIDNIKDANDERFWHGE